MRIFLAHGGGEAFARWREEQGADAAGVGDVGGDRRPARRRLARLARRSCAVPTAPRWPPSPSRTAPRSAFHAWLQWALELQFTAATDGMTVIQDLPIGVAGGGADAWVWQEVLAEGVSVGRPAGRVQRPGPGLGLPAAGARGGCATPTTSRSSSRSGPRSPAPAACASTT